MSYTEWILKKYHKNYGCTLKKQKWKKIKVDVRRESSQPWAPELM